MTSDIDGLITNPAKTLASWTPDHIADVLRNASDAYYNTGKTILTDDLFDYIKDHLQKVAPLHPFLQEIGAAPSENANKVTLPYWMGSLDKIRDDPKALDKWKAKYPGSVVISDKLDGNSAMMVFSNGNVRMYSRGNGKVGQDISHLIPFIAGVPKYQGHDIAVRGELIISRSNWEKIKHLGANARNVVAGALHRKQPDSQIASHIDFVSYELLHPRTLCLSEQLAQLEELGFKTVFRIVKPKEAVTMDQLSHILIHRRKQSPYEVDGIVVVHDTIHKQVSGKNPTYGFAYKSILTHEEAEVIVSHVEWNVSKDGYIKPTIHFPAVVLSGAKLQKVTGFNGSFIEKNMIGPGSRIIIIRSGDVIPHITSVLSPAVSGKPSMPDFAYEWTETRVDIRITTESKDQKIRTLEHFATTLDIAHVAIGTLKKLAEHGFDTIPKLLSITEDDIVKIDGFQQTSARKIAHALASVKKNVSCTEMMSATNVFGRGFGKRKVETIVAAFPSIFDKKIPSQQELCSVSGIGEATAKSFLDGLPTFFQMMDELQMSCRKAAPTKLVSQPQTQSGEWKKVKGLRIVFTGFRNKEWERALEAQGATLSSSVSKNADLIVAADVEEDSAKIKKAKELNIALISREQFEKNYRTIL